MGISKEEGKAKRKTKEKEHRLLFRSSEFEVQFWTSPSLPIKTSVNYFYHIYQPSVSTLC